MNYNWCYCLDEAQDKRFARIINKIPGFVSFLDANNSDDFLFLVEQFKMVLAEEGKSTAGLRANLNLLGTKYIQYKAEYADRHRTKTSFPSDFQIDHVLTWPTRPLWAQHMEVKEIDYLDHFIPQVPGLSKYLMDNPNVGNLYDLVTVHQMRLNATGQNDPDINFALETIKERFYRIMDDHTDAIHYVNHSHQIDDHLLIEQFLTEAKEQFYLVDLEKDICSDFTMKYLHNFDPYIASECFLRFFRANHTNIAMNFAHKICANTFSSPNIYWHNKEAIYGCANVLNTLVVALGEDGYKELFSDNNKEFRTLIHTLYHLLSRIIYWTDKETVKDERYDDQQLPIHVQHKLRAYRLRANLLSRFSSVLLSEFPDANVNMMVFADLFTAHYMAYSNKIVGENSVFYRDAIRIFHTCGFHSSMSPEQVSEKGFLMNDALAQSIHANYKNGKYVLNVKELSSLLGRLRTYFKNQKEISVESEAPLSYLKEDNFSPAYKSNKEQIKQYLVNNGIHCFYHVTDRDRLNSIIKFQGLLSYKRCLDEGVVMPLRDDMANTRDIDAKFGLEDYARLSFCRKLPKIEKRLKDGSDLVLLKISTDVALFEETQFTDIEATDERMHHGKTFDDLKLVNIKSTQSEIPLDPKLQLQRQAEVLVKGIIPLKYILNIKNPEKIG